MSDLHTLEQIEAALAAGQLEAMTNSGKWRVVRRNGKTKRWVRDPSRFRIGLRFGLYGHASINNHDLGRGFYRIAQGADRDFKVVLL